MVAIHFARQFLDGKVVNKELQNIVDIATTVSGPHLGTLQEPCG
jgi:hypothetical protein